MMFLYEQTPIPLKKLAEDTSAATKDWKAKMLIIRDKVIP